MKYQFLDNSGLGEEDKAVRRVERSVCRLER
jgi:hypothetical protein